MIGISLGSEPFIRMLEESSSFKLKLRLSATGELQLPPSPPHIPQSSNSVYPKQIPAQSMSWLFPSHIPQSSINDVSILGLKQNGSGSKLLSTHPSPGASQKY